MTAMETPYLSYSPARDLADQFETLRSTECVERGERQVIEVTC